MSPNVIKKIRRAFTLTQQKLADLIGARQHTVARWETGRNSPRGANLKALRELAENSVDLVFADPPFNIGYDYDVYGDDRSHKEYLKWSAEWMRAVGKVLKPTGSFWLAIGDEYAAELKLIAQDKAGFSCRSWVIWYYTFAAQVRVFPVSRSRTNG